MQIHEGKTVSVCGSSNGIKIKIETKSNQKCTTELSDDFSAGDSVPWSGKKLGSCENIKIDATEESISLWIMQEETDNFCPISVTATLKGTSFLLSLPKGEVHNLATSVKEYIAFNMAGKFAYRNLFL